MFILLVNSQYINGYHSTKYIKMNPVGVKSRTYIDIGIENNDKKSKFKVGDYVRISN